MTEGNMMMKNLMRSWISALIVIAVVAMVVLMTAALNVVYADDYDYDDQWNTYKLEDEVGGSVIIDLKADEDGGFDTVTYRTETTTYHNVKLEVLECSNDFDGVNIVLYHGEWSRGFGLDVDRNKRTDEQFVYAFEPWNDEYDNDIEISRPDSGTVKLRLTVTPIHCMENCKITLDKDTYKAGDKYPVPTVTFLGEKLTEGKDYSVSYDDPGTMLLEGKGAFDCENGEVAKAEWEKVGYVAVWCKYVWYDIIEVENPMTVKPKTAKIKFSAVKKKNQTLAVSKVLDVKNTKGTVKYSKTKGNKKIVINSNNGKVTVKKGLKKGKYPVTVKVSDTGGAFYKSKNAVVTFKIVVK